MDTPILFIVFNRPETTKKVFAAIRKIKPRRLFIAADGPRINVLGERERCGQVRKIVAKIDWQCEVKRFYRDRNIGCKRAVSGALDWFFKEVSEGIVLEDDCLPSLSFFKFCEFMLKKYRKDKRVMHISGSNFLQKSDQIRNGYYFTKFTHIWGWATWKRVWRKYDVSMKGWPKVKKQKKINYIFNSLLENEYWYTLFEAVYRGKIDTWDYQWLYAIWKNNGVAINPGLNIVENIGHNRSSTHRVLRNLNSKSEEIQFPLALFRDEKQIKVFENYISRRHYGINLLMVLYQKMKFLFI